MDGNGVSIGVSKRKGSAKWTIEGIGDDPNPGANEPVVQSLGIIGLHPERNPPAEMLDRLQVDGGLAHGERDRSGGKDDCSWRTLGCPLEA